MIDCVGCNLDLRHCDIVRQESCIVHIKIYSLVGWERLSCVLRHFIRYEVFFSLSLYRIKIG